MKLKNPWLLILIFGPLFLGVWGVLVIPPIKSSHLRESKAYKNIEEAVQDIESQEAKYNNLRKDNEKKFFLKSREKLDIGVVYIPGFSATRKEISPVVENFSEQLNANLFMSRFPGHGLEPESFSSEEAESFLSTGLEANEVVKVMGKKRIWVATSTGALVALWVASQPQKSVDALILVSPAFNIKPSYNWLLAGHLGPFMAKIIFGSYREWRPISVEQEKYWHTRYKSQALTSLTRLISWTKEIDLSEIKIPVLIFYTDNDEIVDVEFVKKRFNEFGSPNKKLIKVNATNHVLAGEITSPETVDLVTGEMVNWAKHYLVDFR